MKISENSYQSSAVHLVIDKVLSEYAKEYDGEHWKKINGKWADTRSTTTGETQWPEYFKGIPIYKPYPLYGFLEKTHLAVVQSRPLSGPLFITDERSTRILPKIEPEQGCNFGGKISFTVQIPGTDTTPVTVRQLTREGGTYEREVQKGLTPRLKPWRFQRKEDEGRPFFVCLVVPKTYEPARGPLPPSELGPEDPDWILQLAETTAGIIMQRLREDGRAAVDDDTRFLTRSITRLRTAIRAVWTASAGANPSSSGCCDGNGEEEGLLAGNNGDHGDHGNIGGPGSAGSPLQVCGDIPRLIGRGGGGRSEAGDPEGGRGREDHGCSRTRRKRRLEDPGGGMAVPSAPPSLPSTWAAAVGGSATSASDEKPATGGRRDEPGNDHNLKAQQLESGPRAPTAE